MTDVNEIVAQGVDAESRWSVPQGLSALAEIVQAAYGGEFVALANPPEDLPARTRRDLEALVVALKPVHELAERLTARIDEGEPGCVSVLGAGHWNGGRVSYSRCFHEAWVHRDGECRGCSGDGRKHEYVAGVGCRNPIHWTARDADAPQVRCSYCLDTGYVALPAPWNTVVADEDGPADLDQILDRAQSLWRSYREMQPLEERGAFSEADSEEIHRIKDIVIPSDEAQLLALLADERVRMGRSEDSDHTPFEYIVQIVYEMFSATLVGLDRELPASPTAEQAS